MDVFTGLLERATNRINSLWAAAGTFLGLFGGFAVGVVARMPAEQVLTFAGGGAVVLGAVGAAIHMTQSRRIRRSTYDQWALSTLRLIRQLLPEDQTPFSIRLEDIWREYVAGDDAPAAQESFTAQIKSLREDIADATVALQQRIVLDNLSPLESAYIRGVSARQLDAVGKTEHFGAALEATQPQLILPTSRTNNGETLRAAAEELHRAEPQ